METYYVIENFANGASVEVSETKCWPLAVEIATDTNYGAANERASRAEPNILRANDTTGVEVKNSTRETIAYFATAPLARQFARIRAEMGF